MYIDLPNPRPLSNNVDLEDVWYKADNDLNVSVNKIMSNQQFINQPVQQPVQQPQQPVQQFINQMPQQVQQQPVQQYQVNTQQQLTE